jgi:alkylation response protein AidB-like acyl-CoA dehydrogenase
MEAVGQGLIVEPFLASAVLGTQALALASPAHPLLEQVAAGAVKLALAHTEPGQRYERIAQGTTAARQGDAHVLNGQKAVVLGGAVADYFVVSAVAEGKCALFLVDAKASGLTRHAYPTQDGANGADLILRNVSAERLGNAEDQQAILEAVLDKACAALCAEAVGAMGVLVKLTTEYLKTRKQFGVTLSNFQVLKHRAADMLVQYELAKSMALYAATAADETEARVRAQKISAARVQVSQASRFVSQQAVQTHGGIGVTDELNVSHYFKRLSIINHTLGDADWHLARYSSLM